MKINLITATLITALGVSMASPTLFAANKSPLSPVKTTAVSESAGTFDVKFGYATFNLTLTSAENITSFTFDYGNKDFQLPEWGAVSKNNATMTTKDLGNGMYEYTISHKDGAPEFGTSITMQQIPIMIQQNIPTKNMNFSDYYGLFQHIKINGNTDDASYAQSCQGDACNDPAPGKQLGAYYADWTVYEGHGKYNPNKMPFQNLNTIYYAFGSLNPLTGDAQMFDPQADVLTANSNAIPYLSLMKQKYPYLNLIYSYGGWGSAINGNYQSGDFSVLFEYYPQDIPKLADSMIEAMLRTGFNGIDIDYEWVGPFESEKDRLGGHSPIAVPDPNNPQYAVTAPLTQQQADGYAELIYDLKQKMNALPNPEQYKLSIALMSGVDKIQALANFTYQGKIAALQGKNDMQNIMDNLDHVNMMTYDFHGSFDAPQSGQQPGPNNNSNFQSALAHSAQDPSTEPSSKYNITDAIAALKAAVPNLPDNKIIVGVPAYARIVKLGSPKNTTPQQEGLFVGLADSSQQAQMNTNVSGEFTGDYAHQLMNGGGDRQIGSAIFDYKCILDSSACYYSGNLGSHEIPANMKLFAMDSLPTQGQPGYEAATPWGFSGDTFMSFDNNLSAANKANFVKDKGYGGTFVWEIDGDVEPTNSAYKDKSIMYAMCNVFHGGECAAP